MQTVHIQTKKLRMQMGMTANCMDIFVLNMAIMGALVRRPGHTNISNSEILW